MKKLFFCCLIILLVQGCKLNIFGNNYDKKYYTITDFSPSPNAENVSVFPVIIVNDNYSRETGQYFYFGTTNPPELLFYHNSEPIVNSISLNFLENETRYYWRIKNFYYSFESYDYTYDTGIQSFTTCKKDDTPPDINIIEPIQNEICFGKIKLIAEFNDFNNTGYAQCILEDSDTLFAVSNEDTLSFLWDTFSQSEGEKSLTFKCWDKTGSFSEKTISINIPKQVRFYNRASYVSYVTIPNIAEFYLDRFDSQTIMLDNFSGSTLYSWYSEGNYHNGELFGERVSIEATIMEDDIGQIVYLDVPSTFGNLQIWLSSGYYEFFIIEGIGENLDGEPQIEFYEQFHHQITSNSKRYFLGYYNLTSLKYINYSGCNDSNYIAVETNQIEITDSDNINRNITLRF